MPLPRIIFVGSGGFAVPTLQALLAAGHAIAMVVSQVDRPAGRGRALTPTPVAQHAISAALPLIRTADINAESLPPADAMVVIAFGQKVGHAAVNAPRLGSVNLHASLLPKYRGAAPINWAILSGEAMTGNSVIRLAAKMDAGAVLAQSHLTIGEMETAGELHDRLAIDGSQLVLRVLDDLVSGKAVETPQEDARATLAPKLTRESTHLDFCKSAAQLARQIRGLYPWPGCRVRLFDTDGRERSRLTLVRGRAVPAEAIAPQFAGTIGEDGLVLTGSGKLEIVELQPEGKRPMDLVSYRNGHPWHAGMRLETI